MTTRASGCSPPSRSAGSWRRLASALPFVVPVNFALDGRVIVFRTAADGPLAAATRHAVVAFQADDIDPAARSGWSVAVTGVADHVVHAREELRVAQLFPAALTSLGPDD